MSTQTYHQQKQDKDYESQHKEQQPHYIEQRRPLEETESFTHLGRTINKNEGTKEAFKARIHKARVAFIMLGKICRAKQIKTNLRIFNSNVKAVLLYGSET